MNKKFLSAILFGALMVTSTGTFVSCKDYDDDIDEINNKISGIEGQIKDLQTKIDAGKWITSVSSVTGGFTVAFSDGSSYTITNGKDGAAGEAGAAGTKWTISTDGYWECDGVKTDVKAVGKDGATGEAGKDAQKEVEKRADGWYLWNGTEFEKVTVDAPTTAGVPYYQIDPADENYAIMHIYDATGKNEQAIRLPLNEGLVQLVMLGNYVDDLAINFAKAKTDIKWDGAKAAPKKGEYIITQSFDSLLVQVTPTKFDLASIEDLALMTSQNVKVPVTLGAPVAFEGILNGVTSRAVSEGGLYKISVTPDAITEENVKLFSSNNYYTKPYVSLVATDKVRSTYGTAFSLNEVKESNPNVFFGFRLENGNSSSRKDDVTPGETVWVDSYDKSKVYDAYLTVADEYKADSIKYELVTGKTLSIKSNDKAKGSITFIVHYMDTYGTVYPTAEQLAIGTRACKTVTVTYGKKPEDVTVSSIAATSHVATSVDEKNPNAQSMLVDFAGYFEGMSNSDRILWNADAEVDLNNFSACTWTYTDKRGAIKQQEVTNLIQSISLVDADGKDIQGDKSKFAKLLVKFNENYGNVTADNSLSEFGNGQLVFNITINDPNKNQKQTVAIPFEIKNPTTAEQQKHYAFNNSYYKDGVFSVIDARTVDMAEMITVENEKHLYNINFNDMKVAEAAEDYIYRSGYSEISLNAAGKKGTEYGVEGIVFNYLNRPIELDAFKVKFVDSKAYSIVSGNALSFQSGKVETKTVKYAKEDNKDAFYGVVSALSDLVTVADIANIVTVDFVSPKNGENKDLIQSISIDPATFAMTITSTDAKATVDNTVTVKVKATLKSGETAEGTVTFSIKKFPTAE